jgi:hypothetical protein
MDQGCVGEGEECVGHFFEDLRVVRRTVRECAPAHLLGQLETQLADRIEFARCGSRPTDEVLDHGLEGAFEVAVDLGIREVKS